MIIKNINVNKDNVQDWSDRNLEEFYVWLDEHSKGRKGKLMQKLIDNELARRRQLKMINTRFDKNKEFILKNYGE